MLDLSTAALLFSGIGFLQVVFSITSMEVEQGQSATMWCSHDIHISGNLYWFKQTDGAVPVTIVHMLYTESLQKVEPNYFNNFTKERLLMDIDRKSTSLTIKTVSISDSGIYFCGPMGYRMAFGSGTRLEVKEKNIISEKNDTGASKKDEEQSPVSTEECSGDIFYTLTLLFGGIIFLMCIIPLILAIIREHKRQNHEKATECQAQQHDEKANDSLKYAVGFFSNKTLKTARHIEDIETYSVVVYKLFIENTSS